MSISRRSTENVVPFAVQVFNDNREGTPPLVRLKAVCGPGDQSEPVVTVMLPDEDSAPVARRGRRSPYRRCPISASSFPAMLANGHTNARISTAHALALRLRDQAAEQAGFLASAELPAELGLDVAANLAADEGMPVRAAKATGAAGLG